MIFDITNDDSRIIGVGISNVHTVPADSIMSAAYIVPFPASCEMSVKKATINYNHPLLRPLKIRKDIAFLEQAHKYTKHSKRMERIEKKISALYNELEKENF